tara:strand:+ start:344 stop:559 length:216 start_codon:yes stop_codon:yes gene_type:complete
MSNRNVETGMQYLKRKHKQHFKHLTWSEFITNERLEVVHVAIQELEQEFNIPNDNMHLQTIYENLEKVNDG